MIGAFLTAAAAFGASEPLRSEDRGSEAASTSISVRGESRGGYSWVRSETELVRTYSIDIESLKSVIEDFEAYPRVLPHLVATTVLDRNGRSTTIRQRYEVSVLGYRYPSEYDLRLVAGGTDDSRRWTLSWSLAASDGSVGESRGSWTLEGGRDESGRDVTVVTHRNVALVRKKFPLQIAVMRAFGGRELGRVPDAVFAEAARRSRVLARSPTDAGE